MRKYWQAVVLMVMSAAIPARALAQEARQAGAPKAMAEAAVGTAIEERTLIGAADAFKADAGTLYCFSRVSNAGDSEIQHVWYHGDEEAARVTLKIGGSPWRTHSSKKLPEDAAGDWRCDVVKDGEVLKSVTFKVE